MDLLVRAYIQLGVAELVVRQVVQKGFDVLLRVAVLAANSASLVGQKGYVPY